MNNDKALNLAGSKAMNLRANFLSVLHSFGDEMLVLWHVGSGEHERRVCGGICGLVLLHS